MDPHAQLCGIDGLSCDYYRHEFFVSFLLSECKDCHSLPGGLDTQASVAELLAVHMPTDEGGSQAVFFAAYKAYSETHRRPVLALRRCHRLVSPPQLALQACFPDDAIIDIAAQDLIVSLVLQDTITTKFPPASFLAADFWKKLVKRLEGQTDVEVHEQLLERVLCDVKSRRDVDSELAFKSFEWDGSTGLERPTVTLGVVEGVENNVGLKLWPGGLKATEFFIQQAARGLFEGRRVLELSSGVGFTAITMLRACMVYDKMPEFLLASDFDADVLDVASANIERNGLQCVQLHRVHVQEGHEEEKKAAARLKSNSQLHSDSPCVHVDCHDWTAVDVGERLASYAPDIVYTCETAYLPQLFEPFAALCVSLISSNPQCVIFSFQCVSSAETRERYMATLQAQPLLKVEHVEWDRLTALPRFDDVDCRLEPLFANTICLAIRASDATEPLAAMLGSLTI